MKKTIVHVADYELYRILLPWKCLVSGANSLILGELEKLHPRFSGSCCYDAKYSMEKKRLLAEVVVMEKASLARYKRSGGELFLETERKRSVFSGKARFVRACTLCMIVLSGIFSFRIAKSLFFAEKKPVSSEVTETEEISIGNNAGLDAKKDTLLDGEELLKEIFSSVSRRGGKIAVFSYQKLENSGKIEDEVGGKCTFSVYGCNSEDVMSARYCVVSFKDNEPHFDLELPFARQCVGKKDEVPDSENQRQAEIFSYEDELVAISSVRKQLRNLGAVIESEHNGERTAEFAFFADSSVLYSCLKICAENAEESLWLEKTISLSENKGKCRVSLSFEKLERRDSETRCGEILSLCARYAYLFVHELRVQPKKAKIFPVAVQSPKTIVVREKIGEVRRADGEVFICYRNIDGKMSFEKKELVNE